MRKCVIKDKNNAFENIEPYQKFTIQNQDLITYQLQALNLENHVLQESQYLFEESHVISAFDKMVKNLLYTNYQLTDIHFQIIKHLEPISKLEIKFPELSRKIKRQRGLK